MPIQPVQDEQRGLRALADVTRRAQKGETRPRRAREADGPRRSKLRVEKREPERAERKERPKIQSRREKNVGRRVDTRA